MGTAQPDTWRWLNKEEFTGTTPPTLRFARNPGLDLYGGPLSVAMEHFFDNTAKGDLRTNTSGSPKNSGIAGQQAPPRSR